MTQDRRTVLAAGAMAALSLTMSAGAIGSRLWTGAPPKGSPADFDFLAGEWRIENRRQKTPGEWDEFPAEATVHRLLGGVVSVEELRIPAREFSGMGLRMFDQTEGVWRDFWVNAKSGAIAPPGMPGGFVDGAGVFLADDKDGETPIRILSLWDRITKNGCHWTQAVSRDGGATWQENWLMRWTRV